MFLLLAVTLWAEASTQSRDQWNKKELRLQVTFSEGTQMNSEVTSFSNQHLKKPYLVLTTPNMSPRCHLVLFQRAAWRWWPVADGAKMLRRIWRRPQSKWSWQGPIAQGASCLESNEKNFWKQTIWFSREHYVSGTPRTRKSFHLGRW